MNKCFLLVDCLRINSCILKARIKQIHDFTGFNKCFLLVDYLRSKVDYLRSKVDYLRSGLLEVLYKYNGYGGVSFLIIF